MYRNNKKNSLSFSIRGLVDVGIWVFLRNLISSRKSWPRISVAEIWKGVKGIILGHRRLSSCCTRFIALFIFKAAPGVGLSVSFGFATLFGAGAQWISRPNYDPSIRGRRNQPKSVHKCCRILLSLATTQQMTQETAVTSSKCHLIRRFSSSRDWAEAAAVVLSPCQRMLLARRQATGARKLTFTFFVSLILLLLPAAPEFLNLWQNRAAAVIRF